MSTKEATGSPLGHTPGPWIAVKADLHGDDLERWSVCTDTKPQYFIASIENGALTDTLDTEEANARLIATAPDLLRAAKKVLRELDLRIDAAKAMGDPLPVFDGIADLHNAIARTRERSNSKLND